MAVGKILNIGGMDNKSPKTTQSESRLRVARNIYHTRDDRLIPRYSMSEVSGNPSGIRKYELVTKFNNDVITIANAPFTSALVPTATTIPELYRNNVLVPNHSPVSSLGVTGVTANVGYDVPLKMASFRSGNVLYFMNPISGNFAKYDGVELSAMGSPVPILGAAYAAPGATPEYLQVINHCIDFEGNQAVSESVKFPVLNTAATIAMYASNLVYSGLRPPLVKPILDKEGFNSGYGSGVWENTTPLVLTEENSLSQSPYFITTSGPTFSPVTKDYEFTTNPLNIDTNITQDHQIGTYVLICLTQFTASEASLLDSDGNLILKPVYGLALRVKSPYKGVGFPLKLDATNAKYLNENREWVTGEAGNFNGATLPNLILKGSRNIITFWGSSSSEGVYTFRKIEKSFPYSNFTHTFTVDTGNMAVAITGSDKTILNISSVLNDWYDVSSVKISPNADIQWGLDPVYKNYGLTTYQGLLVTWSDDLVWFSDTSTPPSLEQIEALNFIKVGDTEFGKVVACCGTQDFLFVSREYKNYIVVGNIATGNYRVQEAVGAEVGSWAPNTCVNIQDTVIMLTCNGLYQVSNGVCKLISQNIPKNFNVFDNYTVSEDVAFKLDTTNVFFDLTKDQGIEVAYDEFRDLLLFIKTGASYEGSPALVLNTRLAEFYEWTNIAGNLDFNVSAAQFINSKLYAGIYRIQSGLIANDSELYVEDKTKYQDYASESPIEMYTCWQSIGEPSLEKQLLQLKIFGYIYPDADNCFNVVHYKDWDKSAKITNIKYLPDSSSQYSHKQRLNSDKVLSVSVGIYLDSPNVSFELESMEIEFNSIQTGMKK